MSAITAQTGFAHLEDLPCYKLTFGEASAVVSLYGGQVLSYQPKPAQEHLWLSPLARWQQQQPIRGGVPVCWPWFGPIAAELNPQQLTLPNHGLVRTRLWNLLETAVSAEATTLRLSIAVADFPYRDSTPSSDKHQSAPVLILTLCLTAHSLSINLTCDTPMLQQAALHSYFTISDLANTQLTGIGTTYRDKVKQNAEVIADRPLSFNQEIDRVYTKPAAVLLLESTQQKLRLEQHGFDSTIVWNPAAERSKAMADLTADGYQQFVCVETARLALNQANALNLTQLLLPT